MQKRYVIACRRRYTRETEGVGFEPTVGFPTLDFESSALNRTQPPFLEAKRAIFNVEHPISNATFFEIGPAVLDDGPLHSDNPLPPQPPVGSPGRRICPKNVTILSLPCVPDLLHLVCPHG